jgi:hypothetical protein
MTVRAPCRCAVGAATLLSASLAGLLPGPRLPRSCPFPDGPATLPGSTVTLVGLVADVASPVLA